MRKTLITSLALAASVALAGGALAAEKTINVKFSPGSSSKTVKGSVKGYDGVNYILDAQAGQVVSVLFKPNLNSCFFNFWEPGASEAVHRGEVDGNEYAANLRKSGKNRVQVAMMRSAARKGLTCKYSVTFEIN